MLKRLLSVLLGLFTAAGPGASLQVETGDESVAPDSAGKDSAKLLSAAHNRFGFALFGRIAAQDTGENIFISPSSAAFALTLLYNAAEEQTRAELEQALGLAGLTLEEVNAKGAQLLTELTGEEKDVVLAVANSIWLRHELRLKEDYLTRVRDSYRAEITTLDFADPRTPDLINKWVSEQTHDKITSIVSRIDPLDVAFLINAVYFKGLWTRPFAPEETTKRDFHLPANEVRSVPMMQQGGQLDCLQTWQFQAVRLPYGEQRFRMVVVLPKRKVGLEKLLQELTPENWEKWQGAFSKRPGNLLLPRFKLEYRRMLNDVLSALGMVSMFDPQSANLDGLCERPDGDAVLELYVTQVLQKTFLEVNEEGTEAAAATGVMVGAQSMGPVDFFEMVVDRPFICAIEDAQTGLILFLGVITDPEQN